MDEVERGAVAMRAEETLGGRDRDGGVEGLERREGEDGVVDGAAGAIAGAAVGGELALEEKRGRDRSSRRGDGAKAGRSGGVAGGGTRREGTLNARLVTSNAQLLALNA